MKACYKEQMREADRAASELGGIPGILLMEHAAYAVLEALPKNAGSYGIFCGKGNNAGDGFAVARMLMSSGERVSVYLACGDGFLGDCAVNYEILKRMNADIMTLDHSSDLEKIVSAHSVTVDAIYGTGVRGEISGLASDLIKAINLRAKQVYSVDVPSGMDSNTGGICGVCVKADVTVTFAAYKIGMFLYPAANYAGQVRVCSIGIPEHILDSCGGAEVIDADMARKMIPQRHNNSHKGTYGKTLVIGGSAGMTGAVCLAAKAALTSGCGIVTSAVPASLNPILETKLTEEMTIPITDEDGHFGACAGERIAEIADGFDAVLFGPGIGRDEYICDMLEYIVMNTDLPLIIDADGLYALAKNPDILKKRRGKTVLTPHMGEMERLCGRKLAESHKLEFCRYFAKEYGITLVLKGHHTLVTDGNGRQYINNTGNSGMATAGSGDVLGGIIVSLAARMENITDAAALGVYLHGCAGDAAAEKLGENGMRASSIIDCIPQIMRT
jgi:NAD(P)H-hydrate epimerase